MDCCVLWRPFSPLPPFFLARVKAVSSGTTRMAVSFAPSQEVERRVPQYSYDPDYAWSILKVKIDVKEVTPLSHDAPKPEGHTRFVCISGSRKVWRQYSLQTLSQSPSWFVKTQQIICLASVTISTEPGDLTKQLWGLCCVYSCYDRNSASSNVCWC